mgnify:CR=1 FL=1
MKNQHNTESFDRAVASTAHGLLVIPFVIAICFVVAILFLAPSLIIKIFSFICVIALSLIGYCLSGENNNG